MRGLKIVLAIFCVWSVAWFIAGLQAIYSPPTGAFPPTDRNLRLALSLMDALIYGVALYGIHKRTLITWKLGWVFLTAALVEFLFSALSSTLKLSEPDTWIASAAIAIVSSAVAVYWGFWWKRQRNYFTSGR